MRPTYPVGVWAVARRPRRGFETTGDVLYDKAEQPKPHEPARVRLLLSPAGMSGQAVLKGPGDGQLERARIEVTIRTDDTVVLLHTYLTVSPIN